MKIVHTLWTKPMFNKSYGHLSSLYTGGWRYRKFWLMSQTLSCLQFAKFYENVELVTDEVGYDVLIRKIQLPYTNVRVVLDKLNGYNTNVWALAKIESFKLQEEPFIHADNDFFIYDKFPDAIHQARLVGQNIEIEHDYYELPFRKIQAVFNYVPDELLRSFKKNGGVRAMNAGIIGGSDLDFFGEFAEKAFLFVNKNYERIPEVDIKIFNIIFEQFLFQALSEIKEITVNYLLEDINSHHDGLLDFPQAPKKRKYLHALGAFKKQLPAENHIEKGLLLYYPDYYFRIIDLIRNYKI